MSSADNGIYILETKTVSGEKEYRVAHATAVENIAWPDKMPTIDLSFGDCYKVLLFGRSEIMTKEQAQKKAFEIYDEIMSTNMPLCQICTYGISIIQQESIFPDITPDQAQAYLDSYWNDKQIQKALADQ